MWYIRDEKQKNKTWPKNAYLSAGQTDSQVNVSFRLAFRWPPTCDDFGQTQIRTQVDASFFIVWPPNASRHKLIASQLYMLGIYDFCDLCKLESRLANPFGRPSQVRRQVLV